LQGLLFFAVFLFITTLAGLPLDAIGHAVSRHYGISVQGWVAGLKIWARACASRSSSERLFCCSSIGLCASRRAATDVDLAGVAAADRALRIRIATA